jgi:putative ABC transport system permease protein
MRRNKVGAILIGVQMAITLAILCNALFIIEQRIALAKRPTGLTSNIFVINNQWVGSPTDLPAKLQADLAALRATRGWSMRWRVILSLEQWRLDRRGPARSGAKGADDIDCPVPGRRARFERHGLKLIAGRNFNADEVIDKAGYTDLNPPAAVIITKALADKAFPGKSAVGEAIYSSFQRSGCPSSGSSIGCRCPGLRRRLGQQFNYNSTLMPFRFVAPYIHYIVRAQPGQITQVQKAAEKKLIDLSRARVIEKNWTLTEARADAYQDDRGLVVILSVICAALVAVTAFGIVGLTSYWVAQRRRQIGIRRALGATRQAIVRYFQTENFLIAAAGS